MLDKKVAKIFFEKKPTTISIWQATEKVVDCILQIKK